MNTKEAEIRASIERLLTRAQHGDGEAQALVRKLVGDKVLNEDLVSLYPWWTADTEAA
jgi:hypothetical protein